jgi:hypothetical protein
MRKKLGQIAMLGAAIIGAGSPVMYRGWNQRPFAPWEAPRYNQRKARRRARQMGRKVR